MRAPGTCVGALVGRAPRSRRPPAEMQSWWSSVVAHVSSRSQPARLRCLLDSKATPGSRVSERVGDVAPEYDNESGQCFYQFMRSTGQCAAATFLPSFFGVHGAWLPPAARGQGPRHRIDYVAVPLGQLPNVANQGVGIDLDLSMRCWDHLAVSADARACRAERRGPSVTWTRPRHSVTKYEDPDCLQKFEAELRR
eukprot:8923655-Pyramimonas_sp.AAC.1